MISKSSWTKAHLATAALVVYWSALVLATHWPHAAVSGGLQVSDKTLHFASYAVLAFLFACTVTAYARPTWRTYQLLASIVLLYGVLDELGQLAIPGRQADFWDWIADAAGALLGLTLHRAALAAVDQTAKVLARAAE